MVDKTAHDHPPKDPHTLTPYNHESLLSTKRTVPQTPKRSTPWLPVLIVMVLGVAAFFLVTLLNTPLKVKEKVSLVSPVFISLNRNMTNISEHLEREPKDDADSIERYASEGENLLQDAKKDKEHLTNTLQTVNIKELQSYKKSIEEYLTSADELLVMEEENVKLGFAVSKYIKGFQKQAADITSASVYVYSDPDRFIKTMDTLTREMETFVGELKEVEIKSVMKDAFGEFVTLQTVELQYLKDMKLAIDNRSQTQVATATQKYTSDKKQAEEDYNRASDVMDKEIRDAVDELEAFGDKVETEHQVLRSTYNF